MARAGLRRAFNSIVLIGVAVFLAVGLTMVLPDSLGGEVLIQPEHSALYPVLQASGITVTR